MNHWQSLLRVRSGPRATPSAPLTKAMRLYSAAILPPPEPVPVGSPPWITQSSTRWKVRPSKSPALALRAKWATVFFTEASSLNWMTIWPRGVSTVIVFIIDPPGSPGAAGRLLGAEGHAVDLIGGRAVEVARAGVRFLCTAHQLIDHVQAIRDLAKIRVVVE